MRRFAPDLVLVAVITLLTATSAHATHPGNPDPPTVYPAGSPLRADSIIRPGIGIGNLRIATTRRDAIDRLVGPRATNAADTARPLDAGEWYYGKYLPLGEHDPDVYPWRSLDLVISLIDDRGRITDSVQRVTSFVRGQRIGNATAPRIGDRFTGLTERRIAKAIKATTHGCGYGQCFFARVIRNPNGSGTVRWLTIRTTTLDRVEAVDRVEGPAVTIIDSVETERPTPCTKRGNLGCRQYEARKRVRRGVR